MQLLLALQDLSTQVGQRWFVIALKQDAWRLCVTPNFSSQKLLGSQHWVGMDELVGKLRTYSCEDRL